MSSHFRPPLVAVLRHASHARFSRHTLLLATALIAAGCTTVPQPLAGPDPADPDVRVPATGYRSALRDFHSAQPSEPAPWTGGDAMPDSKKEKP